MATNSPAGGLVKVSGDNNGHAAANGGGKGHHGDAASYDEYGQWAADADVFVPEQRRASIMAVPSAVGRRVSSLGSLHHAGHSSWATAAGHLITAIIGAGVLGLPHAVSWLGWVGGVVFLVVSFATTLWTSRMLTDCYHVKGKRHTSYKWAVLHIMGPRHSVILAICQNLNMFLTTIGYHIAAADSIRYISQLICKASSKAPESCAFGGPQWQATLLFAAVQLMMSQLPNLESAWWASAIGAAMSIGYATLATALGASQATNRLGTLMGREAPPMQKTFGVFNAMGSILFAYNCAIVVTEIEDTLREPPKAAVSMKKTLNVGLGLTFLFYMLVSITGYLALGDAVPGSVLLGFKDAPSWVNIIANLFVLVHMISAYQVFGQPVFSTIEDILIRCFPRAQFAGRKSERALRLGYRSLYVGVTTLVACALPFFDAFTGLVGAVTYFPTAVAYPMLMYCRVADVSPRMRAFMFTVFGVMALIALLATAGSLESIVEKATGEGFKVFGS